MDFIVTVFVVLTSLVSGFDSSFLTDYQLKNPPCNVSYVECQ